MKKLYLYSLIVCTVFFTSACSGFLDQNPDKILTDEQVYNDTKMIESVLAYFYGKPNWGQTIATPVTMTKVDDVCITSGEADNMQYYPNDQWRTYDYTFIREINQFLLGIRTYSKLEEKDRLQYEGEVRFLRAWTYFNTCRSLGGMPIVEDEVFDYTPGMDISTMQYPRATEAAMYDYIIKECTEIAKNMTETPSINNARATKWAALMLKARAAIYAGSLANYNNKMANPIKTDNGEVGIPANLAKGYYETALAAAKEVIATNKHKLQLTNTFDLGRNFYEAVCIKAGNQEVIWARDYAYPGNRHHFTNQNTPDEVAEDQHRCYSGPVLNLVEAFEYKNNRNGEIRIQDEKGNFIFYDKPEDAFANKDARLWGTVIYPGTSFKGTSITLQAGQKYMKDGKWENKLAKPGTVGEDGILITAKNGPITSNENYLNKTGFLIRKFLDEKDESSTNAKGSDMWYPRFRMAEAVLIASEASLELNNIADAIKYINMVRERAGIQPLTEITLDDIVRERRVEFALEDHRYWDLKRWRLADKIWNGNQTDMNSQLYALFPYLVNDPGNPNDKKWVFEKTGAHNKYPRTFEMKNYYNFVDQKWINNNPKLEKNPFQ